ncbi:hypothetical protein ElyMa_002521900 [Elysia marginata]|uniref:Uncharacterized protein n=1 Tax=Elysia marginata TaxID=1093978 RepID=A0AAV4GSS7_9GAST|nr:hypothetical protein ElyMa_002521900 [Elysia marginata]
MKGDHHPVQRTGPERLNTSWNRRGFWQPIGYSRRKQGTAFAAFGRVAVSRGCGGLCRRRRRKTSFMGGSTKRCFSPVLQRRNRAADVLRLYSQPEACS